VSFRELQRCYLEARQGLSWEQTDLRAIMNFSPFSDNWKGGPSSWVPGQRLRGSAALLSAAGPAASPRGRAAGCRSQAWLHRAPGHSALSGWSAPTAQLTSSDGPKEAFSKITLRKNHLLFPLSNICYQSNSSILNMHPCTTLT